MLQCIPGDVPRLPGLCHPGVVENWKSFSIGQWFCLLEIIWPGRHWRSIPIDECFLVGVEPHLCFPKQREWEQTKMNVVHCSTFGVDYATHF
jgi:hypothetical protein